MTETPMTTAATTLLDGSIALAATVASTCPPEAARDAFRALSEKCLDAAAEFDRQARLHALKTIDARVAANTDTDAGEGVLTSTDVCAAVVAFQARNRIRTRRDLEKVLHIPASTIGNRLRGDVPRWRHREIARLVDAGVLPVGSVERYRGDES